MVSLYRQIVYKAWVLKAREENQSALVWSQMVKETIRSAEEREVFKKIYPWGLKG